MYNKMQAAPCLAINASTRNSDKGKKVVANVFHIISRGRKQEYGKTNGLNPFTPNEHVRKVA